MGAGNALTVYQAWGTVLSDTAFRTLTYMALVARDHDSAPWFGMGQEALAEFALGRTLNGDPRHNEAALRAVRRAVTELRRAGAITLMKHPTEGRKAHYRLWLAAPSPDAQRPVSNPPDEPEPVDNPPAAPVDNPPSPDATRPVTKVTHRTFRGQSPDAGRPMHREEEEERIKETQRSVVTTKRGRRAREPPLGLPA